MERVAQAGIDVFILRGNHDAESKITQELVLPKRVKVFTSTAGIERPTEERAIPVAIHGLSFARPHAPESLLKKYKPPVPGAINIGMMHTSLAGAVGHDLYAPSKIEDLNASGFDYWALGHIHKRSLYKNRSVVVMPGNPQGRDINEAGPKSISLVTIADDHSVSVEERYISVAQFERVSVDATDIIDREELIQKIASKLEAAQLQIESEHLVVRLSITGQSPLAWQLRRDRDLLETDVQFKAAQIGNCWIEKVEIDCELVSTSMTDTDDQAADPILELRALVEDEILKSEAFNRELTKIAEELSGQLPAECRNRVGKDQAATMLHLTGLAREGAEDVLARLSSDRSE
jgi:DNA repair protein SbcD/Mre11